MMISVDAIVYVAQVVKETSSLSKTPCVTSPLPSVDNTGDEPSWK